MMLSKELNFICFILLFYFVSSQQTVHQQRHHARRIQQQAKTRKIYAMCPPTFTKIGNECYHLSSSNESWLDSHFACKDKNAKLAEPLKYSDRSLRKYLLQHGKTRDDIWIGGMYNWQRNKWQWGYNGKDMTYQSFSQMKPGDDLKYHCAILNPDLKYRWSAKLCFEKHLYLCQHRMPFVSEKSRQRIYAKWNETFPRQQANEILVHVAPNRRDMQQRSGSRRPVTNQLRKAAASRDQSNNQIRPIMLTYQTNNEINPPDIVSTRNQQNRRKKQQQQHQNSNKSKENRTLILSGSVDLGNDVFRKNKLPRKKKILSKSVTSAPSIMSTLAPALMVSTTTTSTTQNPSIISDYYQTNHHRHNHYGSSSSSNSRDIHNDNEENKQRVTHEDAAKYPVSYRQQKNIIQTQSARKDDVTIQTTTKTLSASDDKIQPTNQYSSNSTSSLSTRQIEKKRRLDNIREKLSKLSDKEKMEYLKLKAQRKAMRNKSINDTIP